MKTKYVVYDSRQKMWLKEPSLGTQNIDSATQYESKKSASRMARLMNKIFGYRLQWLEVQEVEK